MVLRIHTSHRTPESPTTRNPCGCKVARMASATSVLVQAPVVSTLLAAVAAKLASANRTDTKSRLRFMYTLLKSKLYGRIQRERREFQTNCASLAPSGLRGVASELTTKTGRREESMRKRLMGERSDKRAAFVVDPPLETET